MTGIGVVSASICAPSFHELVLSKAGVTEKHAADVDQPSPSLLTTTLLDLGIDLFTHVNEQLGGDQLGRRARALLGSTSHQARDFFRVLHRADPAEYGPPRVLRFNPIEMENYFELNLSSRTQSDLAGHRAYDTYLKLPCNLISCPKQSLDLHSFEREQRFLAFLALHPHKFIARLGHSYEDSTHLHMTTLPSITDASHLYSAVLPEAQVLFYAAEIAIAISHLHDIGVIHGAVMVDNVIIGADGHAVLGGFASAIEREDVYTAQSGTLLGVPEYMAPELICGLPYDGKVDFWSLGCLMYELLTGSGPFSGETVRDVFDLIMVNGPVAPNPNALAMSAACRACIRALLARDTFMRVGHVDDLRVHPVFDGINWQALESHEHGAPAPFVVA